MDDREERTLWLLHLLAGSPASTTLQRFCAAASALPPMCMEDTLIHTFVHSVFERLKNAQALA